MPERFMPYLRRNSPAWLAALAAGMCGMQAYPAVEADTPFFNEPFESRAAIEAREGKVSAGVEFELGKTDNAAFFDSGAFIRLPLSDFSAEGCVEFQELIEWPADGPKFRCPASVLELSNTASTNAMRLHVTHNGRQYGFSRELGVRVSVPATNGSAIAETLSGACLDWADGQWQKIAIAYKLGGAPSNNEIRLYINNLLQDVCRGMPAGTNAGLFDTITIGAPGNSVRVAVDNLRIYPFWPEVDSRPRNLIRNYSYEHDSNADGVPDFWSQIGAPGKGYWGGAPGIAPESRGLSRRTEQESYSGRYSVHMESKALGVGGQAITAIYGLEPGREYLLDAAVKASHPALSLMVCPFDMNGNFIKEEKKTFEINLPPENRNRWVLLSGSARPPLRFRAPAGCRYANLYLLVHDCQGVYWDDLYCIATAEGED